VQPRDLGQKFFLVDKAAAAMLTPAASDKAAPQARPAGATRGRPERST